MLIIIIPFTCLSLGLPTVNDARSIQQSTTLKEGIAANLTCVATGRPQSNITWQYNSTIISANSSNVYEGSPLITTTSVLTINYPTWSMDGQQITCFILHKFSSTMSRKTTLIFGCELFYFLVHILYVNYFVDVPQVYIREYSVKTFISWSISFSLFWMSHACI